MMHIVSFSGGAASFAVAHFLVEKYGRENVLLVFCDTLIEDGDLYRFVVEGAAKVMGVECSGDLLRSATTVPEVYEDGRVDHLIALASNACNEIPGLVWRTDGRDPWQVFKDRKYQGNTRTAHCTIELKGKIFARWLAQSYKPGGCVLHFGFDWSEAHRLDTAINNWNPYTCEALLCKPPYLSRSQITQIIDDYDIELPRLYKMGFSHNNCGGFCVKAGQAHFENLLRKIPDVYAHHEAKQEELMQVLPTAKPFLRMTIEKKLNYMTMREFRQHLQAGGGFNNTDRGGCGCFSDASQLGFEELSKDQL